MSFQVKTAGSWVNLSSSSSEGGLLTLNDASTVELAVPLLGYPEDAVTDQVAAPPTPTTTATVVLT